MEKVIFLDRDGTINEEVSYLHRPEDLVVLPGAAEGIALLKQAGFRVVVVTNQAGIARGYYAPDQMHRLHEYLNSKLLERGAWITGFITAPIIRFTESEPTRKCAAVGNRISACSRRQPCSMPSTRAAPT